MATEGCETGGRGSGGATALHSFAVVRNLGRFGDLPAYLTLQAETCMQYKPLAVDLDGTLIQSDMLIESGFAYVKKQPHRFYRPLMWLVRGGKAHLKAKLAESTNIDVTSLPYQRGSDCVLKRERASGRSIVLATASDSRYAEAISGHLGCSTRLSHRGKTISPPTKARRARCENME